MVVSNKYNVEASDKTSNKKTKVDDTRGGSNIRSWIWLYFDPVYIDNVRHAACKVETVKGKKCGTKYKVNTSTSNCSSHLSNVHGITEDQGKNINGTELIIIPHDEPRQIQLCQYFADWIITDFQLLTVLENPAFKKFINELEPKFKIPCIKSIKKLVHIAYNHSFKLIMEKNSKKTSTYLRHVIADVPTHWNSSYLAWCHLLELEKYIRVLEDEWDLLCNLILILGPFEEVIRYLGGSKYITYSMINPIMIHIINMLKPVSILLPEEINIESIKDIFVELEIYNDDGDLPKKIELDKPMQISGVLEKVQEFLRIKYNEARDSSTTSISTINTSFIYNTTVSPFYKPILLNIFNNPSSLNL
ncbi:31184_t:CDS:2, partial [Gigaspora margarita]